MKKLISLPLLICVCWAALGQSWVHTTTFPDTYYPDKRSRGVHVSVGTKLYWGLGLGTNSANNSFEFFRDFWEYDVLSKKWTKLPDLPGQKRHDAMAFAIGNKIYVGGGSIKLKSSIEVYSTYLKDFYVFNTQTKTWSSMPDLPIVKGEAVALTIGGKGYVITGFSVDGTTGQHVYCYDPATNTWSRKADFPGGEREDAIGFALNGKGYVGGGYRGIWIITENVYPYFYPDFYQYDPASDQWTRKANISNSIDQSGILARGAVIGDDCSGGYVICPRTTKGIADTPSRVVLKYDPSADTWSPMQTYPENLLSGAAWYVNGILYAGIGHNPKIFSLTLKSIAGAGFVCSSETYTITNPSNIPVRWSKSSNLSIVSATSTTITVSRLLTYKGPGWVQGVLQDGCPTTLIKYLHVGPETASFSISSYPYCGSPGDVIDFVAEMSNVNYSWTVNGGTLLGGQGTQSVYALMQSQSMAVHCYVTGTSASNCYGPQGISSIYINQCWGFSSISTSPNPASTYFDVELSQSIEDTEPVEIELRNDYGALVKSESVHGGNFKIDVANLKNGQYILKVKYRDEVLMHRVLIEK